MIQESNYSIFASPMTCMFPLLSPIELTAWQVYLKIITFVISVQIQGLALIQLVPPALVSVPDVLHHQEVLAPVVLHADAIVVGQGSGT